MRFLLSLTLALLAGVPFANGAQMPVVRLRSESAPVKAATLAPVEPPVTELAVPRAPIHVAITPDSKYAYVLCWGGDALVRIDLATKQTAIVPLSMRANEMVLSSDGNYIIVNGTLPLFPFPEEDSIIAYQVIDSAVTVLRTSDHAVHRTIDFGSTNVNMVLRGPAAGQVIALTDSTAEVLDIVNGTVVSSAAAGGLNGVVVNANTLFVTDNSSSGPRRVNLTTGAVTPVDFSSTGYQSFGHMIAADTARGNVFVSACATNCGIGVINASTAAVTTIINNVSLTGGMVPLGDGIRAALPWNAGLLNLSTLTKIGSLPWGGATGALSADGNTLFVRNGGSMGALTVTYPSQYELTAIDIPSMSYKWNKTLSAGEFEYTYQSPLAVSPDGKYAVTVNSATNTVSVVSALNGGIVPKSGDGQSVLVGSTYSTLQAVVLNEDLDPVPFVYVTFQIVPGASGASGTFSGAATVSTDINGVATAPQLTANDVAGGFTVTATVIASGSQTTFHLTNLPPISAPASITATGQSSTSVNVIWPASAGATQYEVHRSAANGVTATFTTGATSFTDTTAAANTAYLYKVRVTAPATSPYTTVDLATTTPFTDASLLSQPAKAAHVTELRTAVNAVRTLAGLGAFSFTDPSLASVPVKAVHLNELRTALDAARAALSLSAVSYAHAIAAGSTPRSASVTELRDGTQ